MIELTPTESEYLAKVLQNAHTEMLHMLHRASTKTYKDHLKQELEINEEVTAKVEGVLQAVACL